MMRIRLPLGRGLFFLCAFLFALIALLPLRVALDWFGLGERGLSAREANGSVWFGAVEEARMGEIELGDLGTRLRTLPLLLGQARLEVKSTGGGETLEGAVTSSRHGFGVEDVSARLRLAGTIGPLPIASIDTSDVSVRFADGLCENAEGRVKASLSGDIGGMALPALSGNARCNGGALLLPLVSQSGMESLQLSLHENGSYRVELLVRPAVEGLQEALIGAGFQPGGNGYVLRLSGEL
jgi:general secretion pathway protein N